MSRREVCLVGEHSSGAHLHVCTHTDTPDAAGFVTPASGATNSTERYAKKQASKHWERSLISPDAWFAWGGLLWTEKGRLSWKSTPPANTGRAGG